MKTMLSLFIVSVALMSAGNAFAEGHCNYTQENMFAGPFKVCDMPADAAACEELGNTDDNTDAVQGDGSCASEGMVGTCDMGDVKRIYYEGDPVTQTDTRDVCPTVTTTYTLSVYYLDGALVDYRRAIFTTDSALATGNRGVDDLGISTHLKHHENNFTFSFG